MFDWCYSECFIGVILGVGLQGEVLEVTKRLARNMLLPAGAAVYASPENLARNEEQREVGAHRARGHTRVGRIIRLNTINCMQ